MDNTIDSLSIINDENNFQSNKNCQENENSDKSSKISKRKITDEFDFEKSLEISNIIQKDEKMRQNNENDNNNIDLNLSLECSFFKPNDNMINIKQTNNIRAVKTMPIKKLKMNYSN